VVLADRDFSRTSRVELNVGIDGLEKSSRADPANPCTRLGECCFASRRERKHPLIVFQTMCLRRCSFNTLQV